VVGILAERDVDWTVDDVVVDVVDRRVGLDRPPYHRCRPDEIDAAARTAGVNQYAVAGLSGGELVPLAGGLDNGCRPEGDALHVAAPAPEDAKNPIRERRSDEQELCVALSRR